MRTYQALILLVLALCCLPYSSVESVPPTMLVGEYTLHGVASPAGAEEGFNFTVAVNLTGFNQSAQLYNISISETLAAVRVEHVWPNYELLARKHVRVVFATSNATADPDSYSLVAWHAENASIEVRFSDDELLNNACHSFLAVAEFVVLYWVDLRPAVFLEDVSCAFGVCVDGLVGAPPEMWFIVGMAILGVGVCYVGYLALSPKKQTRAELTHPVRSFD